MSDREKIRTRLDFIRDGFTLEYRDDCPFLVSTVDPKDWQGFNTMADMVVWIAAGAYDHQIDEYMAAVEKKHMEAK